MKRRLVAMALCLGMVLMTVPATAFAGESYQLTMADQTAEEGVVSTSAQVSDLSCAGGSYLSVSEGDEVTLRCEVQDGYLFTAWAAEPSDAVVIPPFCETSFTMPAGDLHIRAEMEKLAPNALLTDGVLTWDAVDGYQSSITFIKEGATEWEESLSTRYIDAEGGKYTFDVMSYFQDNEWYEVNFLMKTPLI